MTEIATKSSITLKGSAQMIQEFFRMAFLKRFKILLDYGINNILYQRGIYPPDSFSREKKYGMTLLASNIPKIQKFLEPLLEQLVLVITDIATKSVVERWQFDIQNDTEIENNENAKPKDEKRIKLEMSDVLRQITASVAFLPLLETRCSFDVLIYTHRDTVLPEGWADSSECHIENPEQVQLRSFSTSIQTVQTKVQYKADL